MKKSKKYLALFLSAAMTLSSLPIGAFAGDEETDSGGESTVASSDTLTALSAPMKVCNVYDLDGDGEKDDVYEISCAAEFEWFANHVNNGNCDSNAVLVDDIDLSGYQHTPIGVNYSDFKGVFDGCGHTIDNMEFTTVRNGYDGHLTYDYQGLFGVIRDGAIVRNFTVIGKITLEYDYGLIGEEDAKKDIGGVVGLAYEDSKIQNVISYVDITDNYESIAEIQQVGGVVGLAGNTHNANTAATIENCKYYGTINIDTASNIGGIVGQAQQYSKVLNCVNYGNIGWNYFSHTGGIVGGATTGALVENCANYGNVTTCRVDCIGGIVGYANEYTTIKNCMNAGEISARRSPIDDESAYSLLGGILGYINNKNFGGLTDCVNIGNVIDLNETYKNECTGAIVGWARDSTSWETMNFNYYLESSCVNAYGTKGAPGNAVPANILTSDMTDWAGLYVVSGDVTIEDRITVNDSVTLVLLDQSCLTAKSGIYISNPCSFTVYGISEPVLNDDGTLDQERTQTGKLVAKVKGIDDDYTYPAIGGGDCAFSIVINGGIIEATSETRGAAIGTAQEATPDISTLTINGGYITANNSEYIECGAAIGGGQRSCLESITINGGTVNATATTGSAAIGGGYFSKGGIITINGGTVNAVTGKYAAAIGGAQTDGNNGLVNKITINGGTVNATAADDGIGIGCGRYQTGAEITINGGDVTAIGGHSGIGDTNGTYSDAVIKINGGSVKAYSSKKDSAFSTAPVCDNAPFKIATGDSLNSLTALDYGAEYDLVSVKAALVENCTHELVRDETVSTNHVYACKYCGVETTLEHEFDEDGFCECGAYEPCEQISAANYSKHGFTEDNWSAYENYFAISNAGQLYWFAALTNNVYGKSIDELSENGITISGGYTRIMDIGGAVLTDDIIVNDNVIDSNGDSNGTSFMSWTPIGCENNMGKLQFDGQNHTISGLYYNGSSSLFVGLIAQIGGSVKNLNIIDSYFYNTNSSVTSYCGAIVGRISSGTIENCYSNATVSSEYYAGGICGLNYGGTVKNCQNAGNITGDINVGGICGYMKGTKQNGDFATITGCYNTGKICATHDESNVGGICSYATTNFDSKNNTWQYGFVIENCYNTGEVRNIYSNSCVGGICGYAQLYSYSNTSHSGTIKNCYNIAIVNSVGYSGAICGKNQVNVSNCYYLTTKAFGENSGTAENVELKTSEQFASGEVAYLLNNQTSTGELAWGQTLSGENAQSTPVLGGLTVYKVKAYKSCVANDAYAYDGYSNYENDVFYGTTHSFDENGFCECGAYEPCIMLDNDNYEDYVDYDIYIGYYAISNAGQLYWFAQLCNESDGEEPLKAVLTQNITLNKDVCQTAVRDTDGNVTNADDFKAWTSINFKNGTFDGNDKTIYGLFGNEGMFSYIGSTAIVLNVNLVDAYISCQASAAEFNVGGICTENDGFIYNCSFVDSKIFAIDLYETEIFAAKGFNVGAICGINNLTVIKCYSESYIETTYKHPDSGSYGYAYIGGLVGKNYGNLEYSYNSGDIRHTHIDNRSANAGGLASSFNQCSYSYIGGLCGLNMGRITSCYSLGDIVSSTNYYAKQVILAGAILGENSGRINNCYYDSSACGYNPISNNMSTGTTQNVEALSSEQFASGEATYLLNEVDSENPYWYQTIGEQAYPAYEGLQVYRNKHIDYCPVLAEDQEEDYATYSYSNVSLPDTYLDHVDSDNDGRCDRCGRILDSISTRLLGNSLILDGAIGINFYMEIYNRTAENDNAYMVFELENGETRKVKLNSVTKNDDGYYVYNCRVAAADMTMNIKAYVAIFDGDEITQSGTVYEFNVQDYAKYIIDNSSSYSEQTVALVKAMLNYGTCAQLYFDRYTQNYANSILDDDDQGIPNLTDDEFAELENIKAYVNNRYNESFGKLTYFLNLGSETSLKIRFTPAEDINCDNLRFFYNDEEVKATYDAETGTYIIVVRNIPAGQLLWCTHSFEIKYYNSNGKLRDDSYDYNDYYDSIFLSAAPLSYAYSYLTNESVDKGDGVLAYTLITLYRYNKAALDYLASLNS